MRLTRASVAMKPSMVAMFGMDHAGALGDAGDRHVGTPDARLAREAAFGSVSVVMIALAALNQLLRLRSATQAGSPAAMRSTGSGSMITPVENGRT